MEYNYFKNKRTDRTEISPIIKRLQANKDYQSPWKFLPSVKKERYSSKVYDEKSLIDIRKKKIRLELPKINSENNDRNRTSVDSIEQNSYREIKNKVYASYNSNFKYDPRVYSDGKKSQSHVIYFT